MLIFTIVPEVHRYGNAAVRPVGPKGETAEQAVKEVVALLTAWVPAAGDPVLPLNNVGGGLVVEKGTIANVPPWSRKDVAEDLEADAVARAGLHEPRIIEGVADHLGGMERAGDYDGEGDEAVLFEHGKAVGGADVVGFFTRDACAAPAVADSEPDVEQPVDGIAGVEAHLFELCLIHHHLDLRTETVLVPVHELALAEYAGEGGEKNEDSEDESTRSQ
ncbi:MAG: hypothetical protein K9L57_01920 [Spirochaetaceae bacterium]|nr:hypothetical protein [Spirochaetaceae bacterium]